MIAHVKPTHVHRGNIPGQPLAGPFWDVTFAVDAIYAAANGMANANDIHATVRRGQSGAFLLGEQWRAANGDHAARWYGQLPRAIESAYEHVLAGGGPDGVAEIITGFAFDAGGEK